MKIAVMLAGFNGGAPKSLMQYIRILINNGHSIFAVGHKGQDSIVTAYEDMGVTVKEVDGCISVGNGLTKFAAMVDMLDCVLKWQPDCIICASMYFAYFILDIIKRMDIKFLCVVPGGNIKSLYRHIKNFQWNSIIAFSEENKEELIKNGYQGNVMVIANRIPVIEDSEWKKHYLQKNKSDCIKLLMATRFDGDKVESIKYVIDITEKLIEYGLCIELNIVGGGRYHNTIKEYITIKGMDCNNINVLGFQQDIIEYYREADICFGKGRSILEPAILGRYVVCVSEDRSMSIVTTDTFTNLAHYNFAGRNIEQGNSLEELKEFILNIRQADCLMDLEKTKKMVIKEYGVEELENKFYQQFFVPNYIEKNTIIKEYKQVSRIKIWFSFIISWLKLKK